MRVPYWTGFKEKTLWDWLDLLLVPVFLLSFSWFFQWEEDRRQTEIQNKEAALQIALSTSRYQQEVLKDYFKDIPNLVADDRQIQKLPIKEVLGARTLVTIQIFKDNSELKSQVIRFIGNASLSRFVPLKRLDLKETNLSYVDLNSADLRMTQLHKANLTGALLNSAHLEDVNLIEADLRGADLQEAKINENTSMTGAKYDGCTKFSQSLKNKLRVMQKINSSACSSN
jgi:Pentapeptide repeats (8 copies)